MVRGPASVLAGAADDKIVLGKDVATWRDIAQHFNEFVDLKAKDLWKNFLWVWKQSCTSKEHRKMLR